MKPLVSIIIPTKNEEKNIGRCLSSSTKQSYPEIEIIVVDNHSEDKTLALAKKYSVKVFLWGQERSSQRNFGVRKAKGQYLLFLDADMELEKEVVSEAVRIMEMNKKLAVIVIPEVSAGKNYWARVRALERNCYLNEPLIESPRFFRKNAFVKSGGFDQDLTAAEDWDIKIRVVDLQNSQISRTKAKIIHDEGSLSLIPHLRKKFYYAQNVSIYSRKHPQEFKNQAGLFRVKIFLKNWKKLICHPLEGMGVFVLKSLEFSAYLLSRV